MPVIERVCYNDLEMNHGDILGSKRRLRIIIPAFPAFNIYSGIARLTTALGPVYVTTVVNKTDKWDVEIIDENNYRRFGPKDASGLPDHEILQKTGRLISSGSTGVSPALFQGSTNWPGSTSVTMR